MPATTLSPRLRSELQRVVVRLAGLLARQRERGRNPDVEPVPGYAIDEGEAEGLVAELVRSFGSEPAAVSDPSPCIYSIDTAAQECDAEKCSLARVVDAFDLDADEYEALLLTLGVEVDGRFARLIAFLNDHVGHTRPTLGLVDALVAPDAGFAAVGWSPRPAIADGLFEVEGTGPCSGRTLRIAEPMIERLIGPAAGLPQDPPLRLDALSLDAPLAARTRAWAAMLVDGSHRRARALIVGKSGSGRTALAQALLAEWGGVSLVREPAADLPEAMALRAMRRDARWWSAALVVRVPSGWKASTVFDAVAGLDVPVVAVAEASDAVDVPGDVEVFERGCPGVGTRVSLWRAMLGARAPRAAVLNEVAAAFRFDPRRIRRVVDRVVGGCGAEVVDRRSLLDACREIGRAAMPPSAQVLPTAFRREQLVLGDELLSELDLARGWITNSRTVFDNWGLGDRIPLGRGLTALFSGESGTGKTMTAQVLARELGLDLYRVDLSTVMSKYIGETEKNLARLFDRAADCGGVLFFDEGDALFGRRSEVRDARDRYANVEIGYLLQRMEEHEGATIVATNRLGDLDEAFMRRFHLIMRFALPDAGQRLRLWRSMLVDGIPGARDARDSCELSRLAEVFESSGGEIRNAVLAATFMAASDDRALRVDDLKRALGRELRKAGRILDQRQRRELAVA